LFFDLVAGICSTSLLDVAIVVSRK